MKIAPEGGKEVALGEVYLFYNDKFYLSMAGTIPAGGIYLAVPSDTPALRTRSIINVGDGSGTTGISTLQTEHTAPVWYSLDGRRLNTMPTRKGIYIMNGRKMIIK